MNGFNVTVSQLKHLITDTPAPITLPLNSTAQREGRGELSGKEIHVTIGDTECKPVQKGTKVLINGLSESGDNYIEVKQMFRERINATNE